MSKIMIPPGALAQHTILLGKTGSGKSSVLRLFVEWRLREELPVCIIDPKGDWWGLKSSADGRRAGFPVVIFGGEHADVPINAHAGAQVAELYATGNRPCIVDLGGWMPGERSRFFIDFASTLFRLTRGPRWLVIDEVHNFVPQGKVMDPDAGKMLHWGNRLITEGRGKGLTVLSASQRPQKVHKDFVTSNETLIAMRVIHELDRLAMKAWVDGAPDREKGRELLESIATMKRGEAWVWSPEIGFGPKRVTFPLFETYDSFAAPETDADQHPHGWATVDLEDVKTKLSASIEQAQANDPKLLKKQIRELEQQIARGAGAAPADVGRARTEGFEAGKAEGYSAGKIDGYGAAITEYIQPMLDRVRNARSVLDDLLADEAKVKTWAQRMPRAARAPTPTPSRQAPPPAPRQRALSRGDRHAGVALPRAERRILVALAQYPDGRTKSQVAILTGYAVNGGGFNNAISALRSAGRLEGTGDALRITQKGLDDLGAYDPLPSGDALLQHWLGQLGKAERTTLEVLAAAYPRALSKEEAAQSAGYEPSGGGFNNALSRLRTLELITGRGELRASEDLFG